MYAYMHSSAQVGPVRVVNYNYRPGEESFVVRVMLIGTSLAVDIVAHTSTVPSPSVTLTMVGSEMVTSAE